MIIDNGKNMIYFINRKRKIMIINFYQWIIFQIILKRMS